jgi:ribosomal protein S10
VTVPSEHTQYSKYEWKRNVIHKRLIDIRNPSPKVIEALTNPESVEGMV